MARADLLVVIAGDNRDLLKSLRNARRSMEDMADVFQSIGTKLSLTLTPAILGVGGAAVKMAGDLEQTKIGFETMLKSADKAQSLLDDLAQFALSTPFDFPGLADAAKRLLAMGFAADEIIPTMRAVGDAVAAVGGGQDVIDGVTLALGQMRAKAKVSAEEMNQLAERGIPAWEILAEKIGVDIPQAMKLAEQGALDGVKAVAALTEGLSERFAGSMEKQADTLLGVVNRLKDEAGGALRDLGEVLTPMIRPIIDTISDIVAKAREMVKAFGEMDPATQRLVVGFAAFLAAVGPLFVALGGVVTAITAITALSGTMIAAIAATAAGFAGLITASISLGDQLKAVGTWIATNWGRIWEAASAAVALAGAVFQAIADTPVFTALIRGAQLVGKAFQAAFGAVGSIVSAWFGQIVAAYSKLLDLLGGLDNEIGKQARRLKAALETIGSADISNIEDRFAAIKASVKGAGDAATDAGPKFGGLEDFLRSGAAAAKGAKDEFALFLDVLEDGAKLAALELEAVRSRTMAIAEAARDVAAPAFAAVANELGKLPGLMEEIQQDAFMASAQGMTRIWEAAKALGFVLQNDVKAGLEAAKEAYRLIEQAMLDGLATEQDVFNARIGLLQAWKEAAKSGTAEWSQDLEDELNARLEQTKGFVAESTDEWTRLAGTINGIFDQFSQSLVDVILGAQTLSDAFIGAMKAIGTAILDEIVGGAMKLLKAAILENDAAVKTLIESFRKFIGLFGFGGKNSGGSKGGDVVDGATGGGGGAPTFGGVIDTITSIADLVVSIVNAFTLARIENDVARIEVSTREINAEMRNLRADDWARQDAVLAKWDLAIPALWDIKESIRDLGVLLAGGVTPSEFENDPANPIFTEPSTAYKLWHLWILGSLDSLREATRAIRDMTRETLVPHAENQTALLAAILMQLSAIRNALGGDDPGEGPVPTIASARSGRGMFGAAAAVSIGSISVGALDPMSLGEAIIQAMRDRGDGRSAEPALNF